MENNRHIPNSYFKAKQSEHAKRLNGSPGALAHVRIRDRDAVPESDYSKSRFDMCRTDSSFEISVAPS
jgi:hypothetical protein